ncbi:GAF and ANTAR domain-containing protein [Streptomyces sp. NPDC021019]|uniref:GAF and ANTAR domain-containing protein n=1 Tax=Streptomyces sp. NPDC021019 TaxID=3365108 RepID=UPI003796E9AB
MSSQKVAEAFVSLVDTLDETVDPSVLMHRLVSHSVTFTDAESAVLLMVSARGGLRPMAVSNDGEGLVAVAQRSALEGPCPECRLTGRPVRAHDLSPYAERWPDFVPLTLRAGFCSVYAQPVRVHRQTIGVLMLLREAAGPWDGDGLSLVEAFTNATAVALMQWRADPVRDHDIMTRTQSMISAKATLETAKGMLAAHAGLTAAEAGEVLGRYAREQRLGPGAVARALVGGTLAPDAVITGRAPEPH